MIIHVRSLFLLLALVAFGSSGCARVVVGPPIDTTRPVSVDAVQRILQEGGTGGTTLQDYRLGPGDLISIQLIGQPDIIPSGSASGDAEFLITDNPMLALPLIGAIRVHGKTAAQLQEDLRVAYEKLVINPQPLVIIKKFQSLNVSILGSVMQSGTVPLQPGDTLMDVLLRAGGLSFGGAGSARAPGRYLKVYREKVDRNERADMTMDELIQRVNEGDAIIPREEIEIPIDDVLVNKGFTHNIPVRPNDVIYIPPAGSVSVIGRMGRPGIIFLGPSLRTLRQVLTQAGDMRFGARSMIRIERQTSTPVPEVYYINGRKVVKGTTYDFVLQDGDQIIVDSHPGRVALEFIGNMLARGTRAGVSASYNPLAGGGL